MGRVKHTENKKENYCKKLKKDLVLLKQQKKWCSFRDRIQLDWQKR